MTEKPISRSDYGSTVAGRDVPSPVAPIPAQERGSAARSGDVVGDDTRDTPNGPSAAQPSLLPRCPACGLTNQERFFSGDDEDPECKDEWHDH